MTVRNARWALLICLLAVSLTTCAPAMGVDATGDTASLAGIVRVEVVLDPFFSGADLARELGRQQSPTPFQAELRRRLLSGATGTAFCVAPDLLVTTAHVVLGGARYSGLRIDPHEWGSLEAEVIAYTRPWVRVGAVGAQGARMPVEVLAVDVDRDLALLRLLDHRSSLVPLPIVTAGELAVGSPVSVAGYTAEGFWVARGRVQSLIRGRSVQETARIERRADSAQQPIVVGSRDGDIVRVQHSALSRAGVSGGPLLDTAGSVVGVAYGMLRRDGDESSDGAALNLAIAAPVLASFLKEQLPLVEQRSPALRRDDAPLRVQRPPAAGGTALSCASDDQLREFEGYIRRGNGLKAIPHLDALVRRNRYDLTARLLLARACHQECRYAPQATPYVSTALLNAAWLAYFVPESAAAADARAILTDHDAASKAELLPPSPAVRAVLLSARMDDRLTRLLTSGVLPTDLAPAQAELRELLAQCEAVQQRADRDDPIAAAALVRAYLIADEAAGLRPPRKLATPSAVTRSRIDSLRKALVLAQRVARLVDGAPGGHALAGTAAARLWRLQAASEDLQAAHDAYRAAAAIDPRSPQLVSALDLLGGVRASR